jgi:hypothetical protein
MELTEESRHGRLAALEEDLLQPSQLVARVEQLGRWRQRWRRCPVPTKRLGCLQYCRR